MPWFLKYKLSRLGRQAMPDHGFDMALRQKLMAAGYLPQEKIRGLRYAAYRFRITVGAMASVMFFGGGIGAYAYASDEVLPDHPLYSVRTAVERMELTVSVSGKRREEVRLNHLRRRMLETARLNERNRPLPPAHVERLLSHLESVIPSQPPGDAFGAKLGKSEEARALIRMDREELVDLVEERRQMEAEEQGRMIDEELKKRILRMDEDLQRLPKERRIRKAMERVEREEHDAFEPMPEEEDLEDRD